MENGAKQSRSNSRMLKWLLLLVSTCFALLAAEVALRCCWHNPYANESPDRVVKLRMLHANADHRLDRSDVDLEKPNIRFRVDDRSYILPSFQFENPDCTIAFLGGSTTECCAVDESLRFPALVSSLLHQQNVRATTLNAGTSGNTVHDSINILLNHVEQDDPDIVVMMHACNDIGLLSADASYRSRSGNVDDWRSVTRSILLKLSCQSSLLGISRQILNERRHFLPTDTVAVEGRPVIAPSKVLDGAFEKRLRIFVRMAKALEIKPVIMTQPMSTEFTEFSPSWLNSKVQSRFNDIVRRVGREEDVLVIDLAQHLVESVPNWTEHLNVFYDGIHVTDTGSQIYAQHIASVLSQRLAGSRSREDSESNSMRTARGPAAMR